MIYSNLNLEQIAQDIDINIQEYDLEEGLKCFVTVYNGHSGNGYVCRFEKIVDGIKHFKNIEVLLIEQEFYFIK